LLELRGQLLQRGVWVEYASLAWMTVESLVAVGAGVFAGSLALLAFGSDSFIELISSYTVLAYMRRLIRNPNLGRTQLGTERVEKITALLLISLVPMIALGSVYAYLVGHEAESSVPGILVAVGAVIIMPILWIEKRKIGKEANCLPLTIDAIESATCFFMSVALLGALLINYIFDVSWIDYVATAIILLFVAKEALESLSKVRAEHEQVLTSFRRKLSR
jgi:divalent metal cation (Fe/Co/Zn/Cd) transporter